MSCLRKALKSSFSSVFFREGYRGAKSNVIRDMLTLNFKQTIILFVFVYVDFLPCCPHSRLPVLPMCHHSDNVPAPREKDDGSVEEQKNNKEELGGLQEEEKNKEDKSFILQPQHQQQRFLSTARGLFQGNTSTPTSMPGVGGLNPSIAINRRRIFSLEPFHQSSIISSRLKRGREEEKEEEREEEDRMGNPNKKLTNGKSFPGWCFLSLLLYR